MLITLLVVLAVLVGALSWRGLRQLGTVQRWLLLSLRLLGVVLIAALLINPGRWERPRDEVSSPWLILVDRSGSMSQALGEGSRFDAALELAADAGDEISEQWPVQWRTFTTSASKPLEEFEDIHSNQPASEGGTDLVSSLQRLNEEVAASGERFGGVLVLSDGRQTVTPDSTRAESLALSLRARETALHAVTIGADEPLRDLALRITRPALTVFAGQDVRVPVMLEANGLGALKPELILEDEQGEELARMSVEVSQGSPAFAAFEVEAPQQGGRWSVRTEVVSGELRSSNNRDQARIRLLDSRTRVFLAEGAPYWDSKFLAQLLRQQSHMEVHSVHRISDERFFRINSGDADPAEADNAVFPATLEEMVTYDLIVFGKNVDSFLTPQRLDALNIYVRDHGGAVLFARGKATTSATSQLAALEPVNWGTSRSEGFRFEPTPDGEAVGLFGEALPAMDDSIWQSLPPLQDAREISSVKPFTRILAEGSTQGRFAGTAPALMVRRYGQGVCGLFNGDGLWKWDFYPEARELGNMYEDFWIQLIQWMASYSEFLPGQDYSLRLPAARGQIDQAVSVHISYRGREADPNPGLLVEAPDGSVRQIRPARRPEPSGRLSWSASFLPDQAGDWQLRLIDPREDAPPSPEASYRIPTAPLEGDDLTPDPGFLSSLARATGGSLMSATELPGFIAEINKPKPPAERDGSAVWKSSWNSAMVATILALILAFEWHLRRRQGLA